MEFKDEEDGRVSLIMEKEELPVAIEALMRSGYGLTAPSDEESDEPEGPEAEADERDEPEADETDEPEGPEAEADEAEEPETDESEGPEAEADELEESDVDEPEDEPEEAEAEEPGRGSPVRRRRARAGR